MIVTRKDWLVGPWVATRAGGTWHPGMVAIGSMIDGELVGGVLYAEHNGPNVFTSIAGEGDRWLTREFLWYIFHYPFNELKCRRITCLVSESNLRSQELVIRLGFRLEHKLDEADPSGSLLIYVMKRDECRFLKLGERYGQRLGTKDA